MSIESTRSFAFDADAAIVDRGRASFIEVGEALTRIRDSKSYKDAGFATFEECCEQRFKFSRSRGYQILAATRAVKALPVSKMSTVVDILPPTERQIRAQREPAEVQRSVVRSFSKSSQVGGLKRPSRGGHDERAGVLAACGLLLSWLDEREEADSREVEDELETLRDVLLSLKKRLI